MTGIGTLSAMGWRLEGGGWGQKRLALLSALVLSLKPPARKVS
jgi:hypothetical protein